MSQSLDDPKNHKFLAEGPPGSSDATECQICGAPQYEHTTIENSGHRSTESDYFKSKKETELINTPDPRGDGVVIDPPTLENGQSNIISYANKEPLLFQAGENSSHDYPGKIVINNESNYVDREVKKNTIPGPAATGTESVGADMTQPTIPTGAPQVIPPGVENNKHGNNFNHNLNQDITIDPPEALRKPNEEEITLQPFQEATFNEEDHPRAPEGSEGGGQFVSKDSDIPQGKTPEDKKLREKHFEDTNVDNKKIRSIQDDILEEKLNAGIARVKKESDNEAAAEEKIKQLESEQSKLIQQLKGQGKLEGSEAQATLLEIDRLNSEAAKKKPGSKGETKLKMEVGMMKIRLDLIRRGKIADYDVQGNPTNEAARLEKSEKANTKAAMDKPVTKATKDNLKDFSGSVSVRLGRNVPVETVNTVKDLWNGLDAKDRALVENITIRSSRAKGAITAGEWVGDSNTLEITGHPLFTQKDYEETVHHEIGHAKFRKLPAEKVKEWNEKIKDLRPPTKYANHHLDRFHNYRMNVRFREEDRPIVERNSRALENLYFEEVHSEVYSNKKSPFTSKKIWSKEGLDAATKIFEEMFA